MQFVEPAHQYFQVTLKAFIKNRETILVVQNRSDDLWELPGGRIGQDETNKNLPTILLREIQEELGVSFQCTIGSISCAWIRPSLKKENLFFFITGFECQYEGGDILLSPEHQNFRWVRKDQLLEMSFMNTYREAIEYYMSKKYG